MDGIEEVQVTQFRLNGKLYPSREAAQLDQAEDKLYALMAADGVGRGGSWDDGMISSWMMENSSKLASVLADIARLRAAQQAASAG